MISQYSVTYSGFKVTETVVNVKLSKPMLDCNFAAKTNTTSLILVFLNRKNLILTATLANVSNLRRSQYSVCINSYNFSFHFPVLSSSAKSQGKMSLLVYNGLFLLLVLTELTEQSSHSLTALSCIAAAWTRKACDSTLLFLFIVGEISGQNEFPTVLWIDFVTRSNWTITSVGREGQQFCCSSSEFYKSKPRLFHSHKCSTIRETSFIYSKSEYQTINQINNNKRSGSAPKCI